MFLPFFVAILFLFRNSDISTMSGALGQFFDMFDTYIQVPNFLVDFKDWFVNIFEISSLNNNEMYLYLFYIFSYEIIVLFFDLLFNVFRWFIVFVQGFILKNMYR